MTRLLPRQAAPELSLPTVGGTVWTLSHRKPAAFSMLVFYRHLNCGVCKSYLKHLDTLIPQFEAMGVDALAASCDPQNHADAAVETWGLDHLTVGYEFPQQAAQDWGLYISSRRRAGEPAYFTEPGLFLIEPGGTLYFSSIQTMPFGRTPPDELLSWIPKVVENAIPARGEVAQYKGEAPQ